MKGFIMGLQSNKYHSDDELKTQNKTDRNKNYMSDAEQQEFLESLKKFGIDLT